VGVVLKRRALMAQRRARDVEGTPSRSDLMRPRLEAAIDSESEMDCEEEDDDLERPSACDVDAAWHAAKGLAFVPVGCAMQIEDGELVHKYKRTGSREAECDCCHKTFAVNSYHPKALKAHGVSCAAKHATHLASLQRAAEKADWRGSLSHTHTFDGEGGCDVTVQFEKISEVLGGYARGVLCQCGDKLKSSSE